MKTLRPHEFTPTAQRFLELLGETRPIGDKIINGADFSCLNIFLDSHKADTLLIEKRSTRSAFDDGKFL